MPATSISSSSGATVDEYVNKPGGANSRTRIRTLVTKETAAAPAAAATHTARSESGSESHVGVLTVSVAAPTASTLVVDSKPTVKVVSSSVTHPSPTPSPTPTTSSTLSLPPDPSSSAAAAAAAASDKADRLTVIVSIVFLVLGVLAILTAATVTFIWRKRRGRQSVPGAFVAYMRERRNDDAVSIQSSLWHDGVSVHNGMNLWGVDKPRTSNGELPILGYPSPTHPHSHPRSPLSPYSPSGDLHTSQVPAYPLYRSYPYADLDGKDQPPDYIPYRGPIEPPLPHPCPDASWVNRPLPPLPDEYRDPSTQVEIEREAALNSLGLQLWGGRMSAISSRFSSMFGKEPGGKSATNTNRDSNLTAKPKTPPPRFSLTAAARLTSMSSGAGQPISVERARGADSHVASIVSDISNISNISALSYMSDSAPLASGSGNSYSQSQPRSSHMSTTSGAPTPTAVTGFALNGRRSAATMYPTDIVSDEQVSRARSRSGHLSRSPSYRLMVLRKKESTDGMPPSSMPQLAPATPPTAALAGSLRRHSTIKSNKSVRFAPPATTAYPFTGFGSDSLSSAGAGLKRAKSQPMRSNHGGDGSGGCSGSSGGGGSASAIASASASTRITASAGHDNT